MADLSNKENMSKMDEVQRLRSELIDLLIKRDDLIYLEGESIRAKYISLFASKEYKIISLQADYQKLMTKIEYIKILLEKNQNITNDILAKIDNELELEYIDYRKILIDKERDISWAEEFQDSNKLGEEKLDQMNEMYKKILKVISPEINPKLNNEALDLHTKAVEAYKNKNYDYIELYYELLMKNPTTNESLDESYEDEVARLNKEIKCTNNDIDRIKASYPYSKKEMLADQAQIDEFDEKLDILIFDYEKEIERLEKELAELIR